MELEDQVLLIQCHSHGLTAADLLLLARWRRDHDPSHAEGTDEFRRLCFIRELVATGRLSDHGSS